MAYLYGKSLQRLERSCLDNNDLKTLTSWRCKTINIFSSAHSQRVLFALIPRFKSIQWLSNIQCKQCRKLVALFSYFLSNIIIIIQDRAFQDACEKVSECKATFGLCESFNFCIMSFRMGDKISVSTTGI